MKNLLWKKMRNYLFMLSMILFSSLANAFDPPSLVYRCDTRSMSEINSAGGFFPNDQYRQRDYDLLHHFTGEEVDGYVSGLVSVSYTLKEVIKHCLGLISDADEVYIYMIVPGQNFYNVSASLAAARDRFAQGSLQRNNIERLINRFDNMDEYVARDGFPNGRVLRYTVLDEEMIDEYYYGHEGNSELFTHEFWENRWEFNDQWDDSFDGEVASADIYQPANGQVSEVAITQGRNNTEVPLRFTCQRERQSRNLKAPSYCNVFPIIKKIVDGRKISAVLDD